MYCLGFSLLRRSAQVCSACCTCTARFWRSSSHPWSGAPVARRALEAGIAWFASSLAVRRGAWLGSMELGRRHVVNSLVVSTIAFVVFFFVAETHRIGATCCSGAAPPCVGAAPSSAFPVAFALVAVVSERDLERSALREPASQAEYRLARRDRGADDRRRGACRVAGRRRSAQVCRGSSVSCASLVHWLRR